MAKAAEKTAKAKAAEKVETDEKTETTDTAATAADAATTGAPDTGSGGEAQPQVDDAAGAAVDEAADVSSGEVTGDEGGVQATPVENVSEKEAQATVEPGAQTPPAAAGEGAVGDLSDTTDVDGGNLKMTDAELAKQQMPADHPRLAILDNPDQLELIASFCHDRISNYDHFICGEDIVAWVNVPDWRKDNALCGVIFTIENNLPAAEQVHEFLKDRMIANGWVFGDDCDFENKIHNVLVPYIELQNHIVEKYEIFSETVQVMVNALFAGDDAVEAIGKLDWFDVPEPDEPELPKLLQIDVVSYAAAVGQVAAARIFELLDDCPDTPPECQAWYCNGLDLHEDVIKGQVLELAIYICDRNYAVMSETLFRKAAERKLHPIHVDSFDDCSIAVKAAYSQFSNIVGAVAREIASAQVVLKAEIEAERVAAQHQARTHDISDSTMETHGSAFDLHSAVN